MIRGSRVHLRAIERADLPAFHRWFNDPDVTRFLGIPFPALSFEDEERFFENLRGNSSRRAYAIVVAEGDRLIGNCELRGLRVGGYDAELGIAIGEKTAWGMGYGSEAVELLLRVGFDGLRLHRIWLTVAEYNERGIAAYTKCGFQIEGRLREDRFIDGRWHDTVIMGILEQEWRKL